MFLELISALVKKHHAAILPKERKIPSGDVHVEELMDF